MSHSTAFSAFSPLSEYTAPLSPSEIWKNKLFIGRRLSKQWKYRLGKTDSFRQNRIFLYSQLNKRLFQKWCVRIIWSFMIRQSNVRKVVKDGLTVCQYHECMNLKLKWKSAGCLISFEFKISILIYLFHKLHRYFSKNLLNASK